MTVVCNLARKLFEKVYELRSCMFIILFHPKIHYHPLPLGIGIRWKMVMEN